MKIITSLIVAAFLPACSNPPTVYYDRAGYPITMSYETDQGTARYSSNRGIEIELKSPK